ncbi:uncharacterized protein RB166_015831 [Leptodactylus fuscus]|uniref:uncharacterized protein LOC142216515 n=1 Tax=Leptodactylus fuscus TaxID=238119 RepID=UPI003F4E6BBB
MDPRSERSEMARILLDRLRNYSPNPKYERVSLQLFGMTGHGKSSFINTSMNVVHQEGFKNIAGSGTGKSSDPITMERKDYKLTPKVFITDNRGVYKMSPEEQDEIAAQMGQLRNRSKVEWDRSLREKLNLIHRLFSDRIVEIIVPVFVYSADDLLTDERYKELEPFIRAAHNITDIYPIIVLTKVGNHKAKADECSDKFKNMGANHIFCVENYTVEEHEHNPDTETEILKFLNTCLQEADKYISRESTMDRQSRYMQKAMNYLSNNINAGHEKAEIQIHQLRETRETNEKEIKQSIQMLEDKDRELNELRKMKRRCTVM